VAAAAASTPALVERALERVVDAGLLLPAGEQTGARYAFKHALIQDAAYQSLLRSTRQELHARVAAALLARVPEIALSEPEVVARHYDVSGDVDAAARFYQRASEQAKNRSASAEAMRHAQRALALLDALPGSPERDLRELELQTSLGVMLMANRGSADATVEAIYERIRQLGEKIGEGAGLAQALFGLSHHHQARGELDSAQAVGASLLALAPRCEDDAVLVSAHLALGAPAFWRGDTGEALAHLLETTQRYDPVRHRALAYVYGQDPGVYSRSFAALVLHATGRRERALATSRDAVAHAQDEITRAFALAFAVVLHWMRREPDAAHAGADEVIRIAVEHSFPLWRGAGLLLRGWATAFARRDAAGLAELREGIAQLDATGTDVAVPLKLAIRADAEHAVGAHEEALATVAQALAESRRLGSHVVESRLECLRGQLLVALGRAPEGESALARAIEVAQQQEAHGSELDAAVELARFWAGRGCAERARTLLDESCARLGPLVDAALIEWTRGAVASVASG
jgi:predicted ATPase